jgi:hypothetical protein
MTVEHKGIVSYRVTDEEEQILEDIAKTLFENNKLKKPTVNALSKAFTFVMANQFRQIQAGLAAQTPNGGPTV